MRHALFLLAVVFFPLECFAESSKLEKVDLDVNSTVIVRADLDQDDLYYYVDKTACICWVARNDKQFSYGTTVPCKNLKAHEKLKAALEKCE